MKNKLLPFVIFIILLIIVTMIQDNLKGKQSKVCFKEHCFNVELALTPKERSQGLMFRESLADNQGILLVYEEEGKRGIWMKNTLIPLDIIWINKDKEVVFISENTQPCKEVEDCHLITPPEEAKYVLEINGGISKDIGLVAGDKLDIEYSE